MIIFSEKKDLKLFKNIFDSIPSRIAVIDKSCKLILINKAWSDFTNSSINSGPDVCKTCNQTFKEGEKFFHSISGRLDSCSQVNDKLQQAMNDIISKKQKSFEIEYSCLRTGQKKYFRTSLTPLLGYTDKLVVKHEDITESKAKESEINDLNNFMRLVLDSLPHPFYVIDINDYSIKISNTAAQKSNIETQIKCYEATHKCTKPCSSAEHPCPISIIKKTKKSVKLEHIHYDENNNEKYVEVNAHPIFDKDGNLIQIIEYTFDITDRKTAEKQLKEKNDEILEKNRELEDFTSLVSHDLKQPLTSILGYLDLIKLEYANQLDDQARQYLTNTHNVVLRMKNLINSLLNYARLPKTLIEFSNTDSSKIIKHVLTNLELTINEKNADISYTNLPEIYCNWELLTQVFQNIIGNAIKFNDKDSVKVSISAEQKDKCWEFSIKDNGIGIEKKFLHKIFDAFYRLNPNSRFPGHGIGLSICRKIIELHKGKIWVESEYGKGTTFFFTIPFYTDN